jgi:2-succinyl-6-hydroxy-2,4-cyclohexadiene-1-carboxylate synthase
MQQLGFERLGEGPRMVLVHGFTQNRNCWGPIAIDLSRDHELVLVDAPGHGASADIEADLVVGADLVADAGGDGPATYLGYSMGGRLCLQLALAHPERVARLILVGASPGIADADERERRRASDGALAGHLGEVGLPAFIDEWLAQPLFTGLDAAHRFLRERLDNTVPGLQSSLRLVGTGAQDSLWDRLGEVAVPVLLVTGSDDPKFGAIADQMAAVMGPARHLVVPRAGHTAHLENPDAFLTIVRAWLRSADVAVSRRT